MVLRCRLCIASTTPSMTVVLLAGLLPFDPQLIYRDLRDVQRVAAGYARRRPRPCPASDGELPLGRDDGA